MVGGLVSCGKSLAKSDLTGETLKRAESIGVCHLISQVTFPSKYFSGPLNAFV